MTEVIPLFNKRPVLVDATKYQHSSHGNGTAEKKTLYDHVVSVVYHVLRLLLRHGDACAVRPACYTRTEWQAADVNVVGNVAIYGFAELRSH